MTFGSLFAGIGGFGLGLERAGMTCQWQVEIDDYATRVLERHWPNVPRHRDIRDCGRHNLPHVDLICGGFPCQPFSTASHGVHVAEDLWPEMLRVVTGMRPQYVIAENVTKKPIEQARKDLQRLGYAARSQCIPATLVGADHQRRRWWVIAYPNHESELHCQINAEMGQLPQIRSDIWGSTAFARRWRVPDGVPHRVDRLKCLGNAVVPQVVEALGQMIMQHAVPPE